jgi:hypothetical protein
VVRFEWERGCFAAAPAWYYLGWKLRAGDIKTGELQVIAGMPGEVFVAVDDA